MLLMKIFNSISSLILAVESQKLVSRIVLSYKSIIHNHRDIFYDEMVLIFFHVHHCKALFKKVECRPISINKTMKPSPSQKKNECSIGN